MTASVCLKECLTKCLGVANCTLAFPGGEAFLFSFVYVAFLSLYFPIVF